MLCGCCDMEEVGGTALLGIRLGIRLSKGVKLRKSIGVLRGLKQHNVGETVFCSPYLELSPLSRQVT